MAPTENEKHFRYKNTIDSYLSMDLDKSFEASGSQSYTLTELHAIWQTRNRLWTYIINDAN